MMKSPMRLNSIASGITKVATRRYRRRANLIHLAALLLVVGLIDGNSQPHLARGEPVQQRGQSQHQQQQLQQSVELAGLQDSALPFAISADRALPLGSYTNTKRARKMSAFIPMRGRKDNRDLMGNDSLRELLRSRLMAPMASQQQQSVAIQTPDRMGNQPAMMRESEPTETSLVHLTGERIMIPPQFLHQLQAHSRPTATFMSREQVVEGDNLQQEPAALVGGGVGEQMMQAKLRRAFHPMRGKKAASPELDELYASVRQIMETDNYDNQEFDGAEQR